MVPFTTGCYGSISACCIDRLNPQPKADCLPHKWSTSFVSQKELDTVALQLNMRPHSRFDLPDRESSLHFDVADRQYLPCNVQQVDHRSCSAVGRPSGKFASAGKMLGLKATLRQFQAHLINPPRPLFVRAPVLILLPEMFGIADVCVPRRMNIR